MKNPPKSGRSARNGNAPAPYTKYKKSAYRYPLGKNGHAWPKVATPQPEANRMPNTLTTHYRDDGYRDDV